MPPQLASLLLAERAADGPHLGKHQCCLTVRSHNVTQGCLLTRPQSPAPTAAVRPGAAQRATAPAAHARARASRTLGTTPAALQPCWGFPAPLASAPHCAWTGQDFSTGPGAYAAPDECNTHCWAGAMRGLRAVPVVSRMQLPLKGPDMSCTKSMCTHPCWTPC